MSAVDCGTCWLKLGGRVLSPFLKKGSSDNQSNVMHARMKDTAEPHKNVFFKIKAQALFLSEKIQSLSFIKVTQSEADKMP